MIRILGTVPHRIAVAVSGGVDSMAALDFLRRSREVEVLHYNHGTGSYADASTDLVRDYCKKHNIFNVIGWNQDKMPDGVSPEAWWRKQRYDFFKVATDLPIVTAHHLGDAVENWIFTSLNGNPFLIPHKRDAYLRPFLTTEKSELISWCKRKDVPYLEDITNTDTRFRRNYIRHVMMPHVEYVNPGINKVVKKKYESIL